MCVCESCHHFIDSYLEYLEYYHSFNVLNCKTYRTHLPPINSAPLLAYSSSSSRSLVARSPAYVAIALHAMADDVRMFAYHV